MKTKEFPAPKGIPERMGQIQWMVAGTEVHENHSCPMGHKKQPTQMIEMEASGGTRPVSGSFLWELTYLRARGSDTMARSVPTAMPTNESPVTPSDHPLMFVYMRGYATKHKYNIP
jgi:hypothetical protein